MKHQFNRNIELSFKGDGIKIPPISKLRMSFDIDSQDGSQFYHGVVRIYNLKSSSRAALARVIYNSTTPWAKPIITCTLKVGYGKELIQLISGEVFVTTNQRIGADWITDIEVYVGLFAAKKSATTLDYKGKTSAKKIANDLLSKIIGFDIQYTQESEEELKGKTVKQYSMAGNGYNEAKEFLARFSLDFELRSDGVLLVYKKGKPKVANETKTNENTFKPTNGLLGSPKVTRSGVEFQSLLRPNLRLFQHVYIESQTINETLQNQKQVTNKYFITGLKHIGDTWSDEWYSEVVGAYVGVNKEFIT